ncbi:DsbA family protein [Rhizobium sp. L43]|uniref:DsbA family protein n=1 Tax=Rhizobium sp. L43 TaxID=2035452 RepID=UPI000BE7B71D|nr:DsbA family protein [Rhizobium sp. L43]PDS78894.1 protein-disulfide isomerase [Rhizobium sp. L43]
MRHKAHITYLFDPLCGWCYGASPVLRQLAAIPGLTLVLAPTGLFSGTGARRMDTQFAAFAWSNDERIAQLTGQRFTDGYRNQVLAKGGMLDSGLATLAITAVALTVPARELDALSQIQEARYVSGRDITDMPEIRNILENAGLGVASGRLEVPDADLLAANRQRIEAARALMKEFHIDGVPGLVVDDGQRRRLIGARDLFGNPDLIARLSDMGASLSEATTHS